MYLHSNDTRSFLSNLPFIFSHPYSNLVCEVTNYIPDYLYFNNIMDYMANFGAYIWVVFLTDKRAFIDIIGIDFLFSLIFST